MLEDFALLLVDDHPLFRDGLTAALRHHAPELHAQSVATLAEALSVLAAAEGAIDLVLLDYQLAGTNGLRCANVVMQHHPDVAVGLISGQADTSLPAQARAVGLCAYLSKSLELATLLEHLRQLAQGIPVFCAADTPAPPRPAASADMLPLTTRQKQVLRLLAHGYSNKEIARSLQIAPATAKKHLEGIFSRLGVASRLQAAVYARSWFGEPPAPPVEPLCNRAPD